MTDVYGTACAVRIQFSRRRICARRVGGSLQSARNVRNGRAGSRWRLRRATFLFGCDQNLRESAYRRGSYFGSRLALSAAREIPRGLPEFMPSDYAHEIA